MFTAIILVCIGGIKDPNNCYTYTHEVFTITKEECVQSIRGAINQGIFEYYDQALGAHHTVEEVYCVDWKAERV